MKNKKSKKKIINWKKRAEAESICAAKMSRSIKNRVVFGGDYYFCLGAA